MRQRDFPTYRILTKIRYYKSWGLRQGITFTVELPVAQTGEIQ